eukprot:748520-Hanusia_phi.AAC.3
MISRGVSMIEQSRDKKWRAGGRGGEGRETRVETKRGKKGSGGGDEGGGDEEGGIQGPEEFGDEQEETSKLCSPSLPGRLHQAHTRVR